MDNNDTLLLLPEEVVKKKSRFVSFVRVVWKCTNKWEKFLFLLGVLAAIGTGLTQPFLSYTFGETSHVFVAITSAVNNNTIDPDDLQKAYENFALGIENVVFHFGLCSAAFFTFGFIQFSLLKYVGNNTTYRLRTRYISQLLRKDTQYFDNVSTGCLSTVLNENLERFREVFNEKIAFIICFTTNFMIGTTLAFYTNWKLASLGCVFAIGIAFSGLIHSANTMSLTKKQNKHYASAGSIAYQALGSFKTVTSLNGQRQELEKYTAELNAGEQYGTRRAFLLATSKGLTQFCCNALNGIISYFGVNMIYNQTIDQMTLVTLIHYMLFGAFSLSEALPHFSNLANAISSIEPIAESFNENDSDIEREGVEVDDGEMMEGRIKFRNVRFSYPSRPDLEVLKGVSFNVRKGECVGIVGASGSGKSTIVQLLLHYYNIDSGGIFIDEDKLNDIQLKKLRRNIGVVSQEPILFNTTIEENIRFGNPKATIEQIYDAMRKANAYNFVRALPKGIKTIVGERGAQLSGGQKQRIAIARVLIKNPSILLLDEATSALDLECERTVQNVLENVMRGRSTIIISHRLSSIKTCRKIIVMKQGEIVEVGNHDELLRDGGVYKELMQAQLLDVAENETKVQTTVGTKELNVVAPPPITAHVVKNDSPKSESKKLLNEINEERAQASIWQILKHCAPDWFILLLAIIGSALQGLFFPVMAQIVVHCYQVYAMNGDDILAYGHFWAAMFFVLGFLRTLTQYCQYYFFGKVSEKLSTRLRVKSFKHLLSQPCAFYDSPNHSSIKLTNRLSAASSVKAAVDARLGNVLTVVVSLIAAITAASFYCWELTIQVLLFFPMFYLAKLFYEKTTVPTIRQDFEAFTKSNKTAVEAFEHIKTVRSLNMENLIMDLIFEQLRPLKKLYSKRAFIQGIASGFSVCCSQLVYAISFKFGGWLVLRKDVMPMEMYLALITLSYTSNLAGFALAYLPDYRKAIHEAGLLLELFTYPATMPFEIADGNHWITKGCVEAEEIKFYYNHRPSNLIFNRLSLTIRPGRTVALVGSSGCGKSTLVSLIQRIYQPVEGLVQIDNRTIDDVNLHHLRSSIAVVPQEPVLFNCSIRENLLYGLEQCVPQEDIEKALRTANAFHFVSQFPQGLDTIVGERGTQLSGGQKQRIAIARAILRKPMILLLDEATSALDAECEKLVQSALDTATEKLTTLVIAHRLSTIANANVIAVLENGEIVERGTHDDLLKQKGAYWKLVQKQNTLSIPAHSDSF